MEDKILTLTGSLVAMLVIVIGFLLKNLLTNVVMKLETGNVQITEIQKTLAVILEKIENQHERVEKLETSLHLLKTSVTVLNRQMAILKAKGVFDKNCDSIS